MATLFGTIHCTAAIIPLAFCSCSPEIHALKDVFNRPFPPTFAICRNCQKLRYWVGFVGVLSVNAGERRSPSERSNPAFRVCINWCLIVFTGKIICCFFRICAFQYLILFHVITASYLQGREQKYTAGSVSSEGDSIFFIAALALSNLAAMY